MGTKGGGWIDQAILALAGRQHGDVALRQLVEVGVGRDAVRHRIKRGWLRQLYRGVYLVGPLESPLSRPMAAVLACGDGARAQSPPSRSSVGPPTATQRGDARHG